MQSLCRAVVPQNEDKVVETKLRMYHRQELLADAGDVGEDVVDALRDSKDDRKQQALLDRFQLFGGEGVVSTVFVLLHEFVAPTLATLVVEDEAEGESWFGVGKEVYYAAGAWTRS